MKTEVAPSFQSFAQFLPLRVTPERREINIEDYECAKYAIFSILEALDFEFYDFLYLLKA